MASDQQPPDTVSNDVSPEQQALRRQPLVVAGLVVVLVAVVAGAIWGVSRSAGGTAARIPASATATVSPRVLYQADWSHGSDGWTLPAGAKIVDGHLELEGIDALSLQIPYVPTTANYAVEMDYLLHATMKGGRFGVTSRDATGNQLYAVSMQCTPETRILPGAWNPSDGACPGVVLELMPGGTPGGFYTSDYVIGTGAQTFRVETQGNSVAMCPVKGDCVVPVTSAKPLGSTQHLSIEVRAVKLQITRVVVTTL